MSQLSNEEWVINQRKKVAVDIAIRLYADTLEYWYVKDFFAWLEEQEAARRAYWAGDGWKLRVVQAQAAVYSDERKRLSKLRRNKTKRAQIGWATHVQNCKSPSKASRRITKVT